MWITAARPVNFRAIQLMAHGQYTSHKHITCCPQVLAAASPAVARGTCAACNEAVPNTVILK